EQLERDRLVHGGVVRHVHRAHRPAPEAAVDAIAAREQLALEEAAARARGVERVDDVSWVAQSASGYRAGGAAVRQSVPPARPIGLLDDRLGLRVVAHA